MKSTETVEHGAPAKEVNVERGEVVYVSGNDVVIKMEDGSLRDFFDVPDSTTITVDGRQLNVHQLKPGMKVEKQTVTTSTPRVITKVETVTGKVWQVSPPSSVILTLEDGTNQTFKIPKGQKFTIDGQETDAFGLKKGMNVSAQRITEVPETVVTQEVRRTGTMPPAPPAPKQDVPVLIVTAPAQAPVQTAAAQPAPAEPAPAKLPKTASLLPLLGLLGMLFCGLSLASMAIRKITL
ncbi:MAG TPA: hypothetical protein VFI45_13125 [Candidatus Acidoferrum sp.]|nr:hypothetical protein [Candidatus Acidoferrum sp.]